MTYLTRGQFRRVCGTDEGCAIWQCLLCKNTFELRDSPERSKWNFCPKCGKSWFNEFECRSHNTPRWHYDRWGNHGDYRVKVKTTAGEFYSNDLIHQCYRKPKARAKWVIESRYMWNSTLWSDWSEWELEREFEVDPCRYTWQEAKAALNYCRYRNGNNSEVKYEYRVRIRKI